MDTTALQVIGTIRTPFTEKFGIPRQPRLAKSATGLITFFPDFSQPEAFRGIESFSHLWLLFLFHQHLDAGWKATVRPPRLGGNQRMGVFATRSSFRPNSIGQSAVKLEQVIEDEASTSLLVSGIDLLDGTPIIDIKPYVPYSDAIGSASNGFLDKNEIPALEINISEKILGKLNLLETDQRPRLKQLVEEVLAQDPRPAYHAEKSPNREYGIRLFDLNIRFHVIENQLTVTAVEII